MPVTPAHNALHELAIHPHPVPVTEAARAIGDGARAHLEPALLQQALVDRLASPVERLQTANQPVTTR